MINWMNSISIFLEPAFLQSDTIVIKSPSSSLYLISQGSKQSSSSSFILSLPFSWVPTKSIIFPIFIPVRPYDISFLKQSLAYSISIIVSIPNSFFHLNVSKIILQANSPWSPRLIKHSIQTLKHIYLRFS